MSDFRDFTPAALSTALAAGEVVLVDVREPPEYQQARIEGAILHPLSSFDPAALPTGEIVLQCGVGKRSLMAAQLCARAGVKVAGHLAGGLSVRAAARQRLSRRHTPK
jgi:rhodanese-related sulfurtransferase